MNTNENQPPSAPAAGSGMEPDGGNLYRPHQMMIHSGRFWRCRHGLTGFAGGFEWVGCKDCAENDPAAARQFETPNREKEERRREAEALCAEIDATLAAHRVICPDAKLLLEATKVCLRGDTKRAIDMVFGPLDKAQNEP